MTEKGYDLAIIGAGAMGLFTADFASRRGASVLLLDRSRIGDPKTASFGLTRSIRNDYLDVDYSRLAFAARQLWLAFEREIGESILVECGCLNLAKQSITHDLSKTYAEQSYVVLTQLGRRAEAFSRDQLRHRFPQFEADIGRLDVEAGLLLLAPITNALRQRLRAAGVTIEEHAQVQRVRSHAGGVTVDTSAGERRAGRLVLTAALGTNDLLASIEGYAFRLPLRPDRPSECKYVIPSAVDHQRFQPSQLPVFAYLDVGIYGHPIIEGQTPGVKISYFSEPAIKRQATAIDSVASFIAECLPSLRDARMIDVEGVDQCSYDQVADDDFILGPLPDLPTVFVGTGWHGTGYKFAPLVGRTLMEMALDHRASVDVGRFNPQRFLDQRGA